MPWKPRRKPFRGFFPSGAIQQINQQMSENLPGVEGGRTRTTGDRGAMTDDDPLTLHDAGTGAERILAELAALRADVRALLERERIRRPGLSRLHHAALAPLLREISAAVGATSWSGRYLVEYAAAHDRQLLRAIEAALGPCDAGMVRRLGRLLGQADGQIVDGCYLVTSSDGGRDGCEWSVTRV